jgi:penicillin V acylase-like amidase (Ntn superfamily)
MSITRIAAATTLAAFVAAGSGVDSAEACTAFQLKAGDGSWIYFR